MGSLGSGKWVQSLPFRGKNLNLFVDGKVTIMLNPEHDDEDSVIASTYIRPERYIKV